MARHRAVSDRPRWRRSPAPAVMSTPRSLTWAFMLLRCVSPFSCRYEKQDRDPYPVCGNVPFADSEPGMLEVWASDGHS